MIYIDENFKCYVKNINDKMSSIETNFFNGKCDEFIEGYRFIPFGSLWTREDGEIFYGEMIAPWKPYEELDAAQRQHEQELASAALILLGGNA